MIFASALTKLSGGARPILLLRGMATESRRPPVPPFSYEDAVTKVRMAEDAWNTRDPDKVKMAYTLDTVWRNRSQFVIGREGVKDFLSTKWKKEQEYRLIKELWCHENDRIAVRFVYEYYNIDNNKWWRAHGNENWEFDENGLMKSRHASINDIGIAENERLLLWDHDEPRPEGYPSLTDMGL
mmetsp:Transcript_35425/g.38337  ORF Transcript_35425/g.38337 Transcript_35425/m.38337 type:complete len:183 (-) Transcript_35425:151-699(-)